MKGVASAYQRAWWRGSPTGHCLDHVSHRRETANLAFPQTVAKRLQERFQKTWRSRCTHKRVNCSDANNKKTILLWWFKLFMNQKQLLLLTLGSEQSMLNHRTDAQALCCWLEFEITTTGREEVWDGKRKYGHKNWTAKSMECLNITEDVLNEEMMFHLQRDRQALMVKLGLKGYSVQFFSHTQWELHKTKPD